MLNNLRALPIPSILSDYKIESVLGQGGFGITYLATEVTFERRVAIKEYYPREFAVRDGTRTVRPTGNQEDIDNFKWGMEAFEKEAKLLARFDDPNIVGVQRFFKENGTAYFVMDYCDGEPLDEIIRRDGAIPFAKLQLIVFPLLSSLERIHREDFLHRDIKPSNIFIRSDGSPVLLDFGAARHENVSHSRSVTSLATDGYGAIEQYSTRGRQGPRTDIYGFAATLYRAITGIKPISASERILDDSLVPSKLVAGGKYPEPFLEAVDKGMAVRPEDRPKSVSEWKLMFDLSVKNKFSEIRSPEIKPVSSGMSQSNNGAPNFVKAMVIVGIIGLLILIYAFNSSPSSNNLSSIVNPTAIPIESEDLKNLRQIKGIWATTLEECKTNRIVFAENSLSKLGEFIQVQEATKEFKREITAVSMVAETSVTNFIVSSQTTDNKFYEEHYILTRVGSKLRLMKRVVTPSVDSAKVFNGKYFQDGENTPVLIKCN
jgi:serine/threonine protein kinase